MELTLTQKMKTVQSLATSNKKIGLVLSGGGIRGMAHIGLLKAMQERACFKNTFPQIHLKRSLNLYM